MVYLPRYGFAQTHYLKYRLRLTHRKRKKGNWMSFKPPALLLKMGYFWSIKSRCGRWKNYLITIFFGWKLFSSDGSRKYFKFPTFHISDSFIVGNMKRIVSFFRHFKFPTFHISDNFFLISLMIRYFTFLVYRSHIW